jgi:predicted adenine nucleotide alpha hydrolase (AANH) superfamily ATPase
MCERERILVHACCASCASYVLPHLAERFAVTAYYYNPNIQPEEEYLLRLREMQSVCERFGIPLDEGPYETDDWWRCIERHRHLPEKSERCWTCYRMRLEKTAERAVQLGIDLITTTLSVSPHKIHRILVREGTRAAADLGIRFHDEDFKKRDGFKRSVERSRELGLTRQDYCGCLLSLEEMKKRREESE